MNNIISSNILLTATTITAAYRRLSACCLAAS
jgi:hypothetical protein